MRLSTTTTILSNNDPTAPEESVFRAMRLCKQAGFVHLDMNFHTQAPAGLSLSRKRLAVLGGKSAGALAGAGRNVLPGACVPLYYARIYER